MKHLFNFLGKTAELVIVFTAVFVIPAAVIALVWVNLDVYKACVTSPTYCAVMSIMAGISVWYYIDWRTQRSK